MTWEFLFFADLVLLLRLPLLLADFPAGVRAWWFKCAVEVVALTVLIVFGAAWSAAVAVSVLAAIAAIHCEQRARDRQAALLFVGMMQVVLLSMCFGPWAAPVVRPWVAAFLAKLGEWSALGGLLQQLLGPNGLRGVLGLLLAANEANLFIRWILGRLQLKPGASRTIDASEYARGRVIGILERMLIYFFVLNGQYGAVGFTLAAKGFTRFKELENRSFAEYVLIGTLLSSGLAMLLAVGIHVLR